MPCSGRESGGTEARFSSRMRKTSAKLASTLPAISISCGVAYGADYGDEKTLFNAADAALYHVKYAGGCGCEVSK